MSYLLRFTLLLLVGGIGCIVMGTTETRQAAQVQETPDVMPCSVFQTRGPTDNHHISLTHFDYPEDLSIVYQEQEYGDGYCVVFMPIFPLGGKEPVNSELRVLLQFNNVAGDDELLLRMATDELTGVAFRSGQSLDSEFQSLLEEGYPGIDVDQCQILHVGRALPNASFGFKMKVAGFAMLTGFFGMGIWAFKSDDYIGGSSKHQPYTATPLPVVGEDLQDDAEMEAYREQFAARYGIQDDNHGQDNSLDKQPLSTG